MLPLKVDTPRRSAVVETANLRRSASGEDGTIKRNRIAEFTSNAYHASAEKCVPRYRIMCPIALYDNGSAMKVPDANQTPQ
jgi:hypothetical protein